MHFRYSKIALLVVPFISAAHASGVLPSQQNKQELDRLERQNNQYLIEEAKRTEKFLQQQRTQRESEPGVGVGASSSVTFKIDKIEIMNDDLFASSPEREAIIERYQGRELGKAEIFMVVKELTDFYISRGYVTTLLGIEPGNIKNGVLSCACCGEKSTISESTARRRPSASALACLAPTRLPRARF